MAGGLAEDTPICSCPSTFTLLLMTGVRPALGALFPEPFSCHPCPSSCSRHGAFLHADLVCGSRTLSPEASFALVSLGSGNFSCFDSILLGYFLICLQHFELCVAVKPHLPVRVYPPHPTLNLLKDSPGPPACLLPL